MKVLFSIPSALALTVVLTSCAYISEETYDDRLDSDNALSLVFSGDEPNTLILEPRMTL